MAGLTILLDVGCICHRTLSPPGGQGSIAADWLWALYQHLWLNYDTQIVHALGYPISKNPNPAFGWENLQAVTLPDYRGRVLLVAGTGSNLSNRTKGQSLGAETHVLANNEMPPHGHNFVLQQRSIYTTGGVANALTTVNTSAANYATANAGNGAAHNNMQPSSIEHLLISAGV